LQNEGFAKVRLIVTKISQDVRLNLGFLMFGF